MTRSTINPGQQGGRHNEHQDGRPQGPSETQTPFELDPRLRADSTWVGESQLSELRLINDARYPWLLLVPRRGGIREAFELSLEDQQTLGRESNVVSYVMHRLFGPAKLNVAALGNVVPQLHVHHVARSIGDPAWPGPVWGHSPAQPYASVQLRAMLKRLRDSELGALFPYSK